jgi:hypothetical protein
MLKRLKIIVALITTTLTLSSCATIFTGTKDDIKFNSTPQGAMIYMDGLEVCKTPCTASIKRSLMDENFEIKLDGYETRVITLDRELNLVSIINLGNILFWGIDAATGSMMKYDKKGYNIKLDKEKERL